MAHSNSVSIRSATPSSPASSQEEPAPVPVVAETLNDPIPEVLCMVTDAQVAQAERSLPNIIRIRQIALRVTNRDDWNDLAGRPYLNVSGCMKVAALFGVSLTGMRVRQLRETIDAEEVFRFVARATAEFAGRELEVEGVASSDERFFAQKNGQRLPLAEIDLNSVRKKAVTNAQCRAIKRILGLGTLTWEDVREAGVRKEDLVSVPYGVASRGRKPSRTAPHRPGGARASVQAKTRLRNMLTEMAVFEDVPFERALRQHTSFEGRDGEKRSADSIEAMSDAWVERTLEKVEPLWRSLPTNGTKQAFTAKGGAQ